MKHLKPFIDMLEVLDKSPKIERFVWAGMAVVGLHVLLYGGAAMIAALRWW